MNARKPRSQTPPAPPVADPAAKNSDAANGMCDAGTGGMIGEEYSGHPAADVTEDNPRTTRPGGMIGEG